MIKLLKKKYNIDKASAKAPHQLVISQNLVIEKKVSTVDDKFHLMKYVTTYIFQYL